MKEHLRRLFTYDEWAIGQSLATLKEPANPEAQTMLSHILAAEKVWMMRLRGEDSSGVALFEPYSLEECGRLSDDLHRKYLEYIDLLDEADLENLITYKNTRGVEFQTPIGEILTHVALHGVYHRGQIALLVRQGGGKAVGTDYIIYTRI